MKGKWWLIGCMVLVLSSCSTTHRLAKKEAQKAPWHTYRIDRAQARVDIDGQAIYSDCNIQAVYDSLIVISLRPVLGLEAFRLEVTKEGVRLIDRLQQRYADADYTVVNAVLQPNMSLRTWQQWLTAQTQMPTPLVYSAMGHTAVVEVEAPDILLDEGARVKQADMAVYEKLNIIQFISNL